jgi:prepilin signal peptidase PulO-like enzyme (type II secretory pathway)
VAVVTTILTALVGALMFGATGVFGAIAAVAVLPKLHRFDDAPPPSNISPIVLVAGSAVLGAILALRHAPVPTFAVAAIASGFLVAMWYCDAKTGIVPDVFSLTALGLIVAFELVNRQPVVLLHAAVLFTPFAAAALFSGGRGMGWGDAKLAAFGGALLGMYFATLAFGVASLVAVIVSSIRHRGKSMPIAFAPYLACAIAVVLAYRI